MSGTVNPEAVLAFSYRRWFQLYFTSNGPNKLRFVHTCRPLLLSLFFRLVIPLKKITTLYSRAGQNFLDRGPFSEIWTKARATPQNSIFHYLVDMCYDVLKKR